MKKILLFAFFAVMTTSVWAQQRPAKKLEAQRVAFITQRLNLTPEEAQQFWPIFNQYTDKLQQIRSSSKADKDFDDMNDNDAEKLMISEFDREGRELDLKKEYYQKLKKVISVKKIAKLYRAEKDFRTMLLERIQQNRENKKMLRN